MYKCDQYPDLVLVKNSASGILELVAQPVKTLVEAVARGRTGCLNGKGSRPLSLMRHCLT